MKLVMYSGGTECQNEELDRELIRLTGKKNPRVTFIPNKKEFAKEDYNEFKRYFSKYALTEIDCFLIDVDYTEEELNKCLSSDVIFLDGGNTFYLLKFVKKNGLTPKFAKFIENGGVLAGLSAGAIMMTPNIHSAFIPSVDADENEFDIKKFKAMHFVDFEFFPHYKNTRKYVHEISLYSKFNKYPIFCCTDGSGIVIDGRKKIFIGEIWGFMKGKKFKF